MIGVGKKPAWRVVLVGAVALAGVLTVGGCKDNSSQTKPTAQTIRIGVTTGLTGTTATYGQSMLRGIKLVVDETNAKGGIDGKKIELQVEDNGGKTDQSVTVAQKLIASNDVVAILGDLLSSSSLAIAPLCQQAKIPMITSTSTSPGITSKGDYIFRTCFADDFQGRVGARFAVEHLKAKNVAVLIDNKSDYSRGLSDAFIKEFGKHGKIATTAYYTGGDSDFRPQLTNVKAKKPDVIYIPGYYTEVGLIAMQARELGMKQTLLGGDGWDSPKLMEIGKKAVEGAYFSTHYAMQNKTPEVQKFVKDYRKKYEGESPDVMAALSYDAARIVVAAIEKSKAFTADADSRKRLRDALAQTRDYAGATGTISLDRDRNAVKTAAILQVRHQHLAYVSTLQP